MNGANSQLTGTTLIIGIDSQIGSHLSLYQTRLGMTVLGTTRRDNTSRIKFELGIDLAHRQTFESIDYCVICAGKTKFEECESNPRLTRSVNVTATFDLISSMVHRGVFTIFLSSNAVFDGTTQNPSEEVKPNPITEYGTQKYLCENLIANDPLCRNLVAIVRLTKMLSIQSPIISQSLNPDMHPVKAYTDINVAPISMDYICEGITRICKARLPGIFHLSGAHDLSYFNLLSKMHLLCKISPGRILPYTPSSHSGLISRPSHSSLGMEKTIKAIDLAPQMLDDFLQSIIQANSLI